MSGGRVMVVALAMHLHFCNCSDAEIVFDLVGEYAYGLI